MEDVPSKPSGTTMAIPRLITFLPIVLPPLPNRWLNLVLALAYAPVVAVTMPGAWASIYCSRQSKSYSALLIAWYAWRWPKSGQDPRSGKASFAVCLSSACKPAPRGKPTGRTEGNSIHPRAGLQSAGNSYSLRQEPKKKARQGTVDSGPWYEAPADLNLMTTPTPLRRLWE